MADEKTPRQDADFDLPEDDRQEPQPAATDLPPEHEAPREAAPQEAAPEQEPAEPEPAPEPATQEQSDPDDEEEPAEPRKPLLQRFLDYHRAPAPAPHGVGEAALAIGKFWIRPINILCGALFLFLCYLFYWQSSIHWVAVIDDAYITFRFVDMFVLGHGWRFNPAGYRVEGFTNFLWALMLVPPHWMGWDLMFVSKIMGMASGVLSMAAGWGLARAVRGRDDLFNMLPPFIIATNSHVAQWAMMGLETLLQVALVVGCFARFEMERRNPRLWLISPLLAVMAAMTRIDSLYCLFPLGIYGIWLILTCRLQFRRFLRWSILCAIPFTLYWGWKTTYFGDILPNTYYAKSRLVFDRVMGHSQLYHFYFRQSDFSKREPAAFDKIDWERNQAWMGALDRVLWNMPGGEVAREERVKALGEVKPRDEFPTSKREIPGYVLRSYWKTPSWLWANFWFLSAVLCSLMAIAPLVARFFVKKRCDFLNDVHVGRILCLVMLPWGMNVYYIHHVNGDWMPAFRFFQVAIPFIAVAAAVGFGGLYQLMLALVPRWWMALPVGAASFLMVGYLAVGTAYEQFKSSSVSIYSWDAAYWGPRRADWYYPERVAAEYKRGFSPPLASVSDYLLLNTVDDGWIFMSDIGQPLWFAEHLNLYDVDGLTDPFLAHAPSVRGRLPRYRTIHQQVLAEFTERDGENVNLDEVEKRAKRIDFENHLRRNTTYIMTHSRPEYLLLFENHPRPDPKTKGFVYPEISNWVSRDPNMKDYEVDSQFPKIGNVFNHVYRRADVAKEIPDDVKLKRLFRVIERNPRMPYLIALLYDQSLKMKRVSPEDAERIGQLVENAYVRWAGEPVVAELARLSRSEGNKDVILNALQRSIREDPHNVTNYWTIANILSDKGDFAGAIETMKQAIPHAGEDGGPIQYHLTWLYESSGNFEGALESARTAAARMPKEGRAWSDLGAVLERSTFNSKLTEETKVQNAREAIKAFTEFRRLSPRDSGHVPDIIGRLERFVADYEARLNPPSPDTPVEVETRYR